MNILPKKSWHVKNKDNATRVETDERLYNQKKFDDSVRALVATEEARLNLLRRKSHDKNKITDFKETELKIFLEADENQNKLIQNEDYVKEKKDKQEKLEKNIGILRYLVEPSGSKASEKPWWLSVPNRELETIKKKKRRLSPEIDIQKKIKFDPLIQMKKVQEDFSNLRELKAKMEKNEKRAASECIATHSSLFPDDIHTPSANRNVPDIENEASRSRSGPRTLSGCSDIQSLDESPTCSSGASKLEVLRAERLARERSERERAAVVICKSMGLTTTHEEKVEPFEVDERRLPFNSIFNPDLSNLAAERRFQHREARRRIFHR